MNRNYSIVFLIAVVTLTACGLGPAKELQISDPAKNLEANAGEQFTLIIDANPSTGYHWELIGDLDGNLVEFVSKSYVAGEPQMPGSGGVEIWKFRAIAPGMGTITLGYYPPGSSDGEPQQKVTFTVTVK